MHIANLNRHHAAVTKCGTLLGCKNTKDCILYVGLLNCPGCLVPSLKRQTNG